MQPTDVALTRLAARQHSLAHRQQALDLGLTARQIQTRVEAGWLVPVHRDVYRLAGGRSLSAQSVLAACLSAGPGAVASHRSAAVLWGLRDVEDERPEITVSGDRHRRMPGVAVHRTDSLIDVDRTRRAGIPVTTPARTLLDLGAVVPVHVVEQALEDALLRRLVTFDLLMATLDRLGRSGRNGAGALRSLLAERDPATAPTESTLEDAFRRVVRRAGLPEPERQHWVGSKRLDFAYPAETLGIEVDSLAWHGGRTDVQRNAEKANVLVAHGWRVLHFTAYDVHRRPEMVIEGLTVAWAA